MLVLLVFGSPHTDLQIGEQLHRDGHFHPWWYRKLHLGTAKCKLTACYGQRMEIFGVIPKRLLCLPHGFDDLLRDVMERNEKIIMFLTVHIHVL